jgi:osmotically-inducible protein OsmY
MKKVPILLITITCLSLISCGSVDGRTGGESYKNYGEKVEDTKLVNAIRNSFRSDPSIPNTLINVSIDRGIVQLSGFVPTHEAANLANLKARSTPGVKDVINNIIVLSSADYANRRSVAERYNTAR